MKDIILSLSGGLDSSTLLYEFKDRIKLAVSFKYGSNHEVLELAAAKKVATKAGVEHKIIDLTEAFKGFKSALLSGKDAVPHAEYNKESISQLVVPFRNGIFLSILAGLADSLGCEYIALANHSNDSVTYPDCSPEFIESMFGAIDKGTNGKVKLFAPYTNITKNDIALRGLKAGLDFDDTYSCYKGIEGGCGECPTCVSEDADILMADHTTKKIKDVNVGDIILTFDETSKKYKRSKILNKFDQGFKDVVKIDDLEVTLDHKIYTRTGGSAKYKFRKVEKLWKSDNYMIKKLPEKFHIITDCKKYSLGYIRGLADSDGCIGSRSVFFSQKNKDVVDNFVEIYNNYVKKTETISKYDKNRDMWVFEGRYSKYFSEKTDYDFNDKNYALGYVAGFIIGDGRCSYNKNNKHLNMFISQSVTANENKCKILELALKSADIDFLVWLTETKKQSFNPGSVVRGYYLKKYYNIPFLYDNKKTQDIYKKFEEHGPNVNAYMELKDIGNLKNFEYIGQKHVYDITTDAGTFIANGIFVHNCNERLEAIKFAKENL